MKYKINYSTNRNNLEKNPVLYARLKMKKYFEVMLSIFQISSKKILKNQVRRISNLSEILCQIKSGNSESLNNNYN